MNAPLDHTAVEQAVGIAACMATIERAKMATGTSSAVVCYASLERTAKLLPAHWQLMLIRAMLPNLSFSDGHGDIVHGVELIQVDLDEETRQNDEPQYGWRAS